MEGTDNHLAVRQLESAVGLYLRKVCSVFNTEDIVLVSHLSGEAWKKCILCC